jgi:hypothetical protein
MSSHLGALVLFAAMVSTVFAVLLRDVPREQVRLALRMFAAFLAAAFVLGWLMFPFPI